MARMLNKKAGSIFLVAALAVMLVSGGTLAACSKSQTTTSAPASTTVSTSTRTTTSAPSTTPTSAQTTTATTSAPTSTGVSAADFYKANVATITVPYAPGGGVDYAARLFAYFWNQVTGGRMLVVNKEGAGGLLGTNYVYAAKPDGLTMGVAIPGSTMLPPMLAQDPAVKFDIKKLIWIMDTNLGEGFACVVGAKSPYNSMDDFVKASGLKFGAPGRAETPALAAGLVIDLFGLKDAKVVPGYGGTADAILAVAKGEVDSYISTTLTDYVVRGQVKQPLLIVDFARGPYFPNVPAVPELLKLTSDQESLLRTFTALGTSQGFWYQPGVPQDRIDFVRAAFDKIVTLDEFKKQSLTKWPVPVPPISGKDFATQMDKTLAAATPERFKQLQSLVDKYVR